MAKALLYALDEDGIPGEFVGFGSLIDRAVIFLHPPVNRQLAGSVEGRRFRCVIGAELKQPEVLDGTGCPVDAELPGPPVAINLDGGCAAPLTPIPSPGVQAPATQLAAAVETALGEAARDDGPAPSEPAPATADKGAPLNSGEPTSRPWYCRICPHAFGC